MYHNTGDFTIRAEAYGFHSKDQPVTIQEDGIVEANLVERQRAANEIMLMIELEMVQFKEWLGTLGVVPVISALRQKALQIQTDTMVSIENKMPELTDRERKILSKHTKSIINQLLKEPILQAKELAADRKSVV